MTHLVVLLGVLFAAAGGRPGSGQPIRHVHASGKSSKPAATAAQVVAALTLYKSDPQVKADVITMTETGHLATTLQLWAARMGWAVYHPTHRGASECAILSRWKLSHVRAIRLTPLTLRTARKAPLYLVCAKIAGGPWIVVFHSPAHNGGLSKAGPYAWPTRVYLSLLVGLHAARMRLGGHGILIAADFNLALERAKNRAQLSKPYPRMKWGWQPGQHPTEGGRVIDGILTNLFILLASVTLPAQTGFDHHAVLTVVRQTRRQRGRRRGDYELAA